MIDLLNYLSAVVLYFIASINLALSSYLKIKATKNASQAFSTPCINNKNELTANFSNNSLFHTQPKALKLTNEMDLSALFRAKNNLDLINIDAKETNYKLENLHYGNYLALLRKDNLRTKRYGSKHISILEKSLSNDSLETFSLSSTNTKVTLSEHLSKKANADVYVSYNLQNSIKSAFDLASTTRWLLRLLPISENLSNANSYYSSLKPLISDPSKNSKSVVSNIWLSNFSDKYDLKEANGNKLNSLLHHTLNTSLSDAFESSRN